MAEVSSDAKTKMPYIPGIQSSDNLGDTFLFVIAFTISGIIIFAYVRWLQRKRRSNLESIANIEQHRPVADEKSRFIASKPIANNLSGTMVFSPGQGMNVSFPSKGKNFASTIINVSAESFVITLPREDTDDFMPSVGDIAAFHTVKDGRNHNFKTSVLQVFSGGLRACAFRHTDNIEVTDRRKKTRVSGESPALFSYIPASLINSNKIPFSDIFKNMQGYIPANMLDISTGGCAMRTRSPLHFNAGDLVGIYSTLPDSDDEEYFVLGGIISAQKSPRSEGGGSILSIEFLGVEEKTKTKLREHISNIIEDEVIE